MGTKTKRLAAATLVAAAGVFLWACKGEPDPTPWCSAAAEKELSADLDGGRARAATSGDAGDAGDATDEASSDGAAPTADPTWFRDVKPIVEAKCTRCHTRGGIGPFPLEHWDDFYRRADSVRVAVASRHMPPWHAARCCTGYHDDSSLTDRELVAVVRWIDTGMTIGNGRDEPPPLPRVGGVSRADVTIEMTEAYTPLPKSGKTDELRCFLMDWPLDHAAFITGVEPVPGERSIVHHLAVATLEGDSLGEARSLTRSDGRAGFDCNRLENMGWRDVTYLGGGMAGGDFPDGLGRKVEAHATVLFQVHYSIANAPAAPDRTKVRFRVDEHAREFKNMAVANLAWMVGDGMKIEAGEKDAVFWYKYEPTLFTRGKTVALRSVTPHMHAFGSRIVVRIVHGSGRRECALEIATWHFGWTQTFWFAEPKKLEPDDEVYVECHFDNSKEHQPNGQEPRDIAWGGENQEMCAAFLNFTEGAP